LTGLEWNLGERSKTDFISTEKEELVWIQHFKHCSHQLPTLFFCLSSALISLPPTVKTCALLDFS
jgi:hypothetical protein